MEAWTCSQVDGGGENPLGRPGRRFQQHNLFALGISWGCTRLCCVRVCTRALSGVPARPLPPGLGSVPALWLCRKHFWEPQPGAANLLSSGFLLCKQLTHTGKKLLQDVQIEKSL